MAQHTQVKMTSMKLTERAKRSGKRWVGNLPLSCHPYPVVSLAPPPTLPWEWLGLKVVVPKTAIRGPELPQGLTPSRGAHLGLKGETICPTWAQREVGGCWVQRELPCGLPGPIRISLQAL